MSLVFVASLFRCISEGQFSLIYLQPLCVKTLRRWSFSSSKFSSSKTMRILVAKVLRTPNFVVGWLWELA